VGSCKGPYKKIAMEHGICRPPTPLLHPLESLTRPEESALLEHSPVSTHHTATHHLFVTLFLAAAMGTSGARVRKHAIGCCDPVP
jgi:hypothetical protein